ncbi:MAG: glutathione S-transferase family protein, partial [Pseudomonadota bacterium]
PTGKVPFLKLANGRGLPESNAIILFLADTVGGGGLIPDDAFTRAQMMSWLFWEQYSHEPAIAVRRYQKRFLEKSDDEIPAALMEKGITALSLLEKQLSHTEYLVGDSITLADIALVAYTRLAPEGGFDLSRYPGIMAWIKRAEGDLRF